MRDLGEGLTAALTELTLVSVLGGELGAGLAVGELVLGFGKPESLFLS